MTALEEGGNKHFTPLSKPENNATAAATSNHHKSNPDLN